MSNLHTHLFRGNDGGIIPFPGISGILQHFVKKADSFHDAGCSRRFPDWNAAIGKRKETPDPFRGVGINLYIAVDLSVAVQDFCDYCDGLLCCWSSGAGLLFLSYRSCAASLVRRNVRADSVAGVLHRCCTAA